VHAVAVGGEARSAPFRVYWVVHLSVGHSVGFLMRPSSPWMSHAAQAITLFARAHDRRLAMQARINPALAHAVHEHGVEAMPHQQSEDI
jgi:predicted O-linked N-acetylglucosamine transferase (SPINDLY family)